MTAYQLDQEKTAIAEIVALLPRLKSVDAVCDVLTAMQKTAAIESAEMYDDMHLIADAISGAINEIREQTAGESYDFDDAKLDDPRRGQAKALNEPDGDRYEERKVA